MKRQSCVTFADRCFSAILISLVALFFVGCAGGSATQKRSYTGNTPVPRPSVFMIYDFAVDAEDVVVDTTGVNMDDKGTLAERRAHGKNWANALSESLVRQLVDEGITAKRATGSTHIPMNAIVVKGQFVSIDEGDASTRTTIGFGAGAEDVHAMVQVYQMRKGGLVRFSEVEAEAHGRKTPGVAGPAAVAAGAGMVAGLVISSAMNVKSEGLDGSLQATVDDMAEGLVERAVSYYKKQGWL